MRRPFVILVTVLSAALFAFAGSASAAVTLGSDLSQEPDDGVFCAAACSWIMGALPGRVTEAPSDGVIVRWRIRTDGPGGPFALQVARPAGGDSRLGISASESKPVAAAGVSEFLTRLPVKQGDNIGIKWTSANTARFHGGAAVPGAAALYFTPALADGESRNASIVNTDFQFFVNADLEADADGDGYGDETQDTCLGTAGSVNGCVSLAPNLTRKVAKRQSIRSLAATVSLDRVGSVIARAVVTYKSSGKRVTIKSKLVKRPLATLVDTKLKFAFTRSQRAKLGSQLKRGRKLNAKINFVARDSAGTSSSNSSATVRLKR